jgi:hypothetical protein
MQAAKNPMLDLNQAKQIADAYIMNGMMLSAGLGGDPAKEQIATLARDYTNVAQIKAELEAEKRDKPPAHPEFAISQTNQPGGPEAPSSQKQAQQTEPGNKIAQRVDSGRDPKEGPTAEALLAHPKDGSSRHSPFTAVPPLEEERRRNDPLELFSRDPLNLALAMGLAAAQAMQQTPEQQQRKEAEKAEKRMEIASRREKIAGLTAEISQGLPAEISQGLPAKISQGLSLVRQRKSEYLVKVYRDQDELARHQAVIERLTPYT